MGHAAKARLQGGDLSVPEATGVGPAVEHDDRRFPLAFDEHVDSVDAQRCIHEEFLKR